MKMRELLSSEDKWTKGASARDHAGGTHGPLDQPVSKWCLWGAFRKCYPKFADRPPIRKLIDDKIGRNWPEWNDNANWKHVTDLLQELDI